jgi:tetratricopeptide (TPR) repeat protein
MYSRSDSAQAIQYYQKALKLSKICKDSVQQSNVLTHITWLNSRIGDYTTARVYAAEAERVSKLSANLYQEARALSLGTFCSTGLGEFGKTIAQLQRGRKILGICGISGGDVDKTMIGSQGEIHLLKSEYAEARSIYHEIIETSSADQNFFFYGLTLVNIAHSDAMSGNTDDASCKLKQAKNIFGTWFPSQMIYCTMVEADIEFREEKFTTARVKFEGCFHVGEENQVSSFCLERLADIRIWPAAQKESKWPMIYLAHAYKSKDKLGLHKALLFLGDVFVTIKDKTAATNLYIVALDGFTQMDVHRSRAQCMIRLGDLAEAQGCISKAIDFWQTAQPLFERSLQAKDVAQIEARLATVQKAPQQASLELDLDQLLNNETSAIEEIQGVHAESAKRGGVPVTI